MFDMRIDLMSIGKIEWFLSAAVFVVYGTICIISLIFTFSLELYYKIDRKLNLDLFSSRALTPLDANIEWLDNWLFSYNIIAGPVFVFLSLLNIKLFFEIILGI